MTEMGSIDSLSQSAVIDAINRLSGMLRTMGSCGVAFSAGIDSTLVLKVAFDTLGPRAVGFIGVSDSLLHDEQEEARAISDAIGVELVWVDTHEIEEEGYQENAGNRCYFCKRELHSKLVERASQRGLSFIIDGLHLGDVNDIRPGVRAADELGVRHPLAEAGFDKAMIRAAAKHLGLSNWDKPAMACLSSRVPFGTRVTREVLLKIAAAETGIRRLGYRGFRVRHHGDLARLEVAQEDLERVWEDRASLTQVIQTAGYVYVAMDTRGYRQGSAHES